MKGRPDFDWNRDFKGFIGKDVVLAVGLSPAHFEKLREPFKKYFLDAARYGLDFKYNGKSFSFHIRNLLQNCENIGEYSSFLFANIRV
uniref:hypothetical protein n=1 Tax=Agathobacter sp. TaxID=2021311 RepID=UPI004055B5C7